MEITSLFFNFSEDNPIIVLVITLILTMHKAKGCPPPPNLKNSTISKISHTDKIIIKGKIILPIEKIIAIYLY